MIYPILKDLILRVIRCPQQPPEAPAGSHDSVLVFRASRAYLRYRIVTTLGKVATMAVFELWGAGVLLLAPKMGTVGKVLAGLILVAACLKAFVMYLTTRLGYDMRYYVITDRSLRIREGVWIIRETTLTFENIQNMRITQGPLQRLFGVSDLVVETAGGGGAAPTDARNENRQAGSMHRGTFRGLGRPAELRDQIMAYLRRTRSTGLGSHSTEPSPMTGTAGFHPAELEALRAIRNEVRAWRMQIAPS